MLMFHHLESNQHGLGQYNRRDAVCYLFCGPLVVGDQLLCFPLVLLF